MLYILTPPYNTGNDFVYNDDFKQSKYEFDLENNLIDEDGNKVQTRNTKSDGKFHTNWLNMMYPRLLLARKLLKEDGVIFISIDDNEQARLKMLCDEVFREENFVSDLIWRKKNTGGGSDKTTIETETEFILVYAKNQKSIWLNKQSINFDNYELEDEYVNERGKYNLTDLDRVSSASSFQYIESLDYEIKAPDGTYFKNYRNIIKPRSYRYTLGKELFDFYNENGFIEFKKTNGHWRAFRKSYSLVTIDRKLKQIVKRDGGNSYNNIIFDGSITTSSGKRELIKLLNDKNFSFPKPTKLIKYILKIASKKDSLILDFFAGSGTTGQAVMELNKEDGGNRKYILVQFPEKSENLETTEFETIADITRERIKRSIQMYDYKEKGFRAFKLSDSNFKSFDATTDESIEEIQKKLMQNIENIKEDVSIQNLIYEIILRDTSLTLDSKLVSKVINNNKVVYNETKDYLFLLEPTIGLDCYGNIIDVIKTIYEDGSLRVYLRDKYFKNDQDKINFFEAIKDINENMIKIEVV